MMLMYDDVMRSALGPEFPVTAMVATAMDSIEAAASQEGMVDLSQVQTEMTRILSEVSGLEMRLARGTNELGALRARLGERIRTGLRGTE